MASLYEEIGGESAVDAAVDNFYVKVLADDRTKDFFSNTDMDKQRNHQKRFLTYVFGGPNNYSGRGMKQAHSRLVEDMGLTDVHFDAVVENLAATLSELGVSELHIGQVAEIANSVKDDVLGRT
jgi:hemoglobin